MTTINIKIGDKIEFWEHDGRDIKTIEKILWSEKGKGEVFYEKNAILPAALEWCIILFDDGYWMQGNANIFYNRK